MLIPKKDRLAVYKYLFAEGVLTCKKDLLIKHGELEVPNLHVIKLMQSLRSRAFVVVKFSWQWYYYTLTNDGIEYLREYLHIPVEIVPATLKKNAAKTQAAPSFATDRRLEGDGVVFAGRPERTPFGARGGRGGFGGRRDYRGPAGGKSLDGAPSGFQPEFAGRQGGRGGFGRGGARGGARGGRGPRPAAAAPATPA